MEIKFSLTLNLERSYAIFVAAVVVKRKFTKSCVPIAKEEVIVDARLRRMRRLRDLPSFFSRPAVHVQATLFSQSCSLH